MEEEITPSPEYMKGFNEGYLIAKELPVLAGELSETKGDGDRTLGFLDGTKEYTMEKIKGLRPNWLKDKNKSEGKAPTRSYDKEKDI
ncbi:hypothetical protein [Chryseolinea sp. H1M3-3]|uniref:hypothetical protein n=1 Tax=Chryseolinea sp. H1M3-3 TaxID=3034144 RepID=UPI0023EBEBF9|nr:hypothetical protein [Chryseolinea sp. H1M3-3]